MKKFIKFIAIALGALIAAIVMIIIFAEPPNRYNQERDLGLEAEERGEYNKALEYYTKACNGDNFIACRDIGISYERGRGTEINYAKAAEYYKKACEGRIGNRIYLACVDLGYIYYTGGYGIKQDYEKAAMYWQPECSENRRSAWACGGLGKLYENGSGVRQDTAKALEYYGIACSKYNEEACRDFARLENAVNGQR